MSIKLTDPVSGSDEIFSGVVFVNDEQSPYFRLTSLSQTEIRVSYIPTVDSSWDPSEFDLFLLDNPYLNAENDVFEIYETSIDERIGWIFPINVLISNDNDFSDSKNLNKYKYVSQLVLLNKPATLSKTFNKDGNILITDIYNESSIICIINKQTTSKIVDFNINNYLLSFYKYGYSFFQETSIRKKILDKEDFIKRMRQSDKRRINIKKALYDVSLNNYVESLFKKYLLKIDDFLVRFIFLYQVIEQLMEEEFNILFQQYLAEFNNQNISKNDFKECLNSSSKERSLIKSVFNNTHIENYLKRDFDRTFDYLYTELNYKIKNPLSDKIYDFRNLVTHNYRNVMDKVDSVNILIQIFEDIIICTLIHYKTVPQHASMSTVESV